MSLSKRLQRWGVATFLVLFALWPLVQRRLVAEHGIDARRFGGWADHTQPAGKLALSFSAVVDGEVISIPAEKLPPVLAQLSRDYLVLVRTLGSLVPPDLLGARVLESIPSAQRLDFVLHRQVFDPEEARFKTRQIDHSFSRRRGR